MIKRDHAGRSQSEDHSNLLIENVYRSTQSHGEISCQERRWANRQLLPSHMGPWCEEFLISGGISNKSATSCCIALYNPVDIAGPHTSEGKMKGNGSIKPLHLTADNLTDSTCRVSSEQCCPSELAQAKTYQVTFFYQKHFFWSIGFYISRTVNTKPKSFEKIFIRSEFMGLRSLLCYSSKIAPGNSDADFSKLARPSLGQFSHESAQNFLGRTNV